jgi:hypothetical protein
VQEGLADVLFIGRDLLRGAKDGWIIVRDVRFCVGKVCPEGYSEALRTGFKLAGNERVLYEYAGLEKGRVHHAVLDLIGRELCGNNYVCNLYLGHSKNLESK